jgi:C-terminal peptidase prc
VRRGDVIARIGDESAKGLTSEEAARRLRGPKGTLVKIALRRRGYDQLIELEVPRDEIHIPTVPAAFVLPGGTGYVRLQDFAEQTDHDLSQSLASLTRDGMKRLVLDLRGNPGGPLDQAIKVANQFLPQGLLIVYTRGRVPNSDQDFRATEKSGYTSLPLVVLTNRSSASASEIVAGALQDHQRAVIVGQRSYGKGSVQELLPIPGERDDVFEDENGNGRHDSWEAITKDWNGNGEFDFAPRARLTVARYRLPSGRSIHRERGEDGRILSEGGVEPQVKADPQRLEPAVITEMRRVLGTKKIRDWLDKEWAVDSAELTRLAECDYDDPSRYPGFDALYSSLETTLTPQYVRELVRREVRGRAQDVRSAAYPDGDFQDDPMLQAAIEAALQKLELTPRDIPEYAATFKPRAKPEERPLLAANLTDVQRTDLRHALTLLGEAQGGSNLSADRLAEIERALKSVLDK